MPSTPTAHQSEAHSSAPHNLEQELPLNALTAISALDGRYRRHVGQLAHYASEYALLRNRVRVEVEWFLALSNASDIDELPSFDSATQAAVRAIAKHFDNDAAQAIKTLEAQTNHDVKAVEYYVKQRLQALPVCAPHIEFVHFAATSEDINNLAYALTLKDAREQLLLSDMHALETAITELAHDYAAVPMLSRTHGQAASPTSMGKELANVVARLARQREALARLELLGKFNGAVGNYNAHRVAYPQLDWPAFTTDFVSSLGLSHNPYTTQIEPHDYMADYFHCLTRFNQILLDFDRDIWSYISIGYFKQKKIAGETGSSTMPHKVNPIDFENSEGNIGIANAQLNHLANKLPVSRWQRDLTDSTVQRNIGNALGHSLLAWRSCLRGINKLELDPARMRRDLDNSWEDLAEPVQTVMRKYGMTEPYEALKAATRGTQLDREGYIELLNRLELPAAAYAQLVDLTPATYLGYADELAANCGPTKP